jgi:hypothetical protein
VVFQAYKVFAVEDNKDKADSRWYDREADLANFVAKAMSRPTTPQFMVGCINVGKSSLHVAALPHSGIPTLHLDMRDVKFAVKTEADLVRLLLDRINQDHPLVNQVMKAMPEFASLPVENLKKALLPQADAALPTLRTTLNIVERLMREIHRTNANPSLFSRYVSWVTGYQPRMYAAMFIDEVQGLKSLGDSPEGDRALQTFFLWAVKINKDMSLGHVFWASSDAFFLEYMRGRLIKPEVPLGSCGFVA